MNFACASVLWIIACVSVVLCQKFQVIPRDVAAQTGSSARFNCTATPSVVSSEDLEWWQRSSLDGAADMRIMSTHYSQMPPPPGYQIDKDEASGRYDLILTNIESKHAADFECLLGLSTEKQAASLTIVEPVGCDKQPSGSEIPDTSEVSLTCTIRYLGSRIPDLVWLSTVGGTIGQTDTWEINPDGYITLKAVANFTASHDSHNAKVLCDMTFKQETTGDLPPSYTDSCDLDILIEGGTTGQPQTTSQPQPTSQPCPEGFVSYENSCFKAVNHVANWADAHDYCYKIGANMARIWTQTENDWLINHLLGLDSSFQSSFWIDVNDIANEGTWVWDMGIPATFTDWAPGQPDNYNGLQHCATISQSVGAWDDAQCNLEYSFVCKIELV